MALIPYILIAVPTCLLAIAIWTYLDYRKYKKKNSSILLLFLFYPTLLHTQYTDRNHYSITFTSHKDQPGTSEQVKDNMIFQLISNNDSWKTIIKSNSSEDTRINREETSFTTNGRVSGISFQPRSPKSNSMDIIEDNSEITRTVTTSKLIVENKINRMYDKQDLKKGGKTSVSIIPPIGVGDELQFFRIFSFIVTQDN